MQIFQISLEDVERSSTLEPEDIGLWCFIINGCIQGFARSREELISRMEEEEVG